MDPIAVNEQLHQCKVGHDIPNWVVIAVAIFALLISFLGFLGNLLTILALPNIQKLRHSATWFVVNLAVTELVFCVTILPMSAAHLFHLVIEEDKMFDDEDNACQLFVFVRFVLIHAELFSIAAIAVNRCVLIAMPKKYPNLFTTKKTLMIIIGIWAYSCFVMAFPLAQVFGTFSYNYCTDECDFDNSPKSNLARKVFLLNGFIIPCAIIIASYSYIFYKSRQSTMRMLSLNKEANSNESPASPATGLRRRDMRIARTIAVIFVVFLLCCTPVSIAHYYGSGGQIPTTLLLLHPLYWLQYCLNGLIYVLMNRQYREAYISYIAIWWTRFPDIVKTWYQEPTEDETSTSISRKISTVSKNSFRTGGYVSRKISLDTPVPSPKATPSRTKKYELRPSSPGRTRKHSKTPSVNKSMGSVESLVLKGTYKPIVTSTLEVVLHDPVEEESS